MRAYLVKVTFHVVVEDDEKYPDMLSVRQAIYDGVGIPGYMRAGLDVGALNCSAERVRDAVKVE